MTNGPIEFISDDGPAHEFPSTEMGGDDGLIQPTKEDRLKGDPEASGGHTLESGRREESGEVLGIVNRAGMKPLDPGVAYTGVTDVADVIDPVTGRAAPTTVNKTGGAEGELSDLKPG